MSAAVLDMEPTEQGERDPQASAGEAFPGATGERGVCLSVNEAARRYGITPPSLWEAIQRGALPTAGTYLQRAGRVSALLWSRDVVAYLAGIPERNSKQRGRREPVWPDVVRREYAARGLGEPPADALGEGASAPATIHAARVWGDPESAAALAAGIPERPYLALYAGLAAALDTAGVRPDRLRAALLDILRTPELAPMLAAMLAGDPGELAAAIEGAPDAQLLPWLVRTLASLYRRFEALMPALAPALAPMMGPELAPLFDELVKLAPPSGEGKPASSAGQSAGDPATHTTHATHGPTGPLDVDESL